MPGQLSADGKSEAGPTELAPDTPVGLLECLKNHLVLICRYPYAGICDRAGNVTIGFFDRCADDLQISFRWLADSQGNAAFFGEFNGIGEQIVQDLDEKVG